MMHTQPGWSGYSVANPEYESKEMYKAVSWAVHSSQLTQDPTLTGTGAASLEGRQPHCLPQVDKDLPLPLQTPSNHTQRKPSNSSPQRPTPWAKRPHQLETQTGTSTSSLVGNPQGFEAAFGPHPRSDHSCPQNRHHPGHQCPLNTQTP
jgi:hypothetical protein